MKNRTKSLQKFYKFTKNGKNRKNMLKKVFGGGYN